MSRPRRLLPTLEYHHGVPVTKQRTAHGEVLALGVRAADDAIHYALPVAIQKAFTRPLFKNDDWKKEKRIYEAVIYPPSSAPAGFWSSSLRLVALV